MYPNYQTAYKYQNLVYFAIALTNFLHFFPKIKIVIIDKLPVLTCFLTVPKASFCLIT